MKTHTNPTIAYISPMGPDTNLTTGKPHQLCSPTPWGLMFRDIGTLGWVNYCIGWIFGVRARTKTIFLGLGRLFWFFWPREKLVQAESCNFPPSLRKTVHKSGKTNAGQSEHARFKLSGIFSVTSEDNFLQETHQHIGLALKFPFPPSMDKTIGSRTQNSCFLRPKALKSNLYYS